MWILTQNGKRILSTEGMEEINVANPAEGRTDYAVMIKRKTDRKSFALGFYRQKDKAADIVKNIFIVQSSFHLCESGQDELSREHKPSYVVVPPKAFQMPKD